MILWKKVFSNCVNILLVFILLHLTNPSQSSCIFSTEDVEEPVQSPLEFH